MVIRLQNSLTKQKEDLIPLDPKGKRINMYTCGVTVYDKCHIGHARSLYVFDMIRRYLQYRGHDVHLVRNITDVDDKIIKKANDLGITSDEVAQRNIDDYYKDLESIGVSKAEQEPRATDNIKEMVSHIEQLIKKGFAYESEGDVYFSVRSFPEYGRLSGQSIEKMMEAVRIDKAEKKKDPLDFALWKKSKDGEPSWPSPWGTGRPGWHIECSVMSLKHLGCETLDIHAGGRDLIFPHHENEIAQAEALTGKPFAKYWIHHGLLTINKQKMAKSLGNFITIEGFLEEPGHSAEDLKMFFISSHYGSLIDYSEEKILEAHKVLNKFKRFISEAGIPDSALEINNGIVDAYKQEFFKVMDDDFNTPQGLGVLNKLVNEVRKNDTDEDLLKQAAFLLRRY